MAHAEGSSTLTRQTAALRDALTTIVLFNSLPAFKNLPHSIAQHWLVLFSATDLERQPDSEELLTLLRCVQASDASSCTLQRVSARDVRRPSKETTNETKRNPRIFL